jgi:hypothetical protein
MSTHAAHSPPTASANDSNQRDAEVFKQRLALRDAVQRMPISHARPFEQPRPHVSGSTNDNSVDDNDNEDDILPIETYTDVPNHMTKDHLPLDLDNSKVLIKHLPKQAELEASLKRFKNVVLHNYHLPYPKREIAKLQASCTNFKEIYAYIAEGLLPATKQACKRVLAQAEDFIILDSVLFRLTKKDDDFQLKLAVPQVIVPYILSLYHDSLIACHQGIVKVAATIKQRFYFPKLYQLVTDYIKTCRKCQQMKKPVDQERPYELNIPDSYTPFSEIACDIKTMYHSKEGFRYLLVMVCTVTRYVILVPLKSKDAMSVAEAIVQKCVLTFGPFQKFVSDQGTEFSNQVIEYVFDALQIKHSFVSVAHHQGNKSERFIGTVSKMLISCLSDTGDNWPKFCNAVAYSYNSFALSILGNYSPYYLVFLRHPPSTFNCGPTLNISSTYAEYVELLKARLEKVGHTILDLQALQQQEQARRQAQKVRNPTTFVENMLVYLLAPSNSALRTKSKKIRLDYIGPLVISKMLDRAHSVLCTLDGKQLTGIFHVCRLKMAWIRTKVGSTNMLSGLTSSDLDSLVNNSSTMGDKPDSTHNRIVRGRFSNGNLQVLVDLANGSNCYHWIDLHSPLKCNQLSDSILNTNSVKVHGSFLTFAKMLCI